jgi:hypothetical protein
MTPLERQVWAAAFALEARWQQLQLSEKFQALAAGAAGDNTVRALRRLKAERPEAGEVVTDGEAKPTSDSGYDPDHS